MWVFDDFQLICNYLEYHKRLLGLNLTWHYAPKVWQKLMANFSIYYLILDWAWEESILRLPVILRWSDIIASPYPP